ncbi:MAG: hypothetical protein ACKONH_04915 [Planctomycetia bacterium]
MRPDAETGWWREAGHERPCGAVQRPSAALALRAALVAAQAATVLVTWNVWHPRSFPPLLPLVELPPFPAGQALLASLAVALFRPRVGVPLHAVVLAVAIVADQSRLQPHVISMATLLWATVGSPGGLVVARGSLAALWLYAGIHKLTSPAYFVTTGPWLLAAVWPGGPQWLGSAIAMAVAVTEVFLGCGCLVPRLRTAVAGVAAVFHVATFAVLALRLHWNSAVWPWNLALAVAGPAIVLGWRGRGLGDAWGAATRAARAVAIALFVLPAGYWLGVVDAFLAHCVYADNRPRAFVCTPFGRTDLDTICLRLGVVLPPAHRLYVPFFRGIGRPGEWLEVEDPRWIARVRGFDRRRIDWDEIAGAAEPPPAASP